MKSFGSVICFITAGVVTAAQLYAQQTITTLQPAADSYCVGTQMTVPFTATGAFESGNAFIVQLSAPDGTFTSFTNLGSISQTGSGSVTVTIPKGTSSGAMYRIRVISSKPVIFGSDNGNDITITEPPNFQIGASTTILPESGSARDFYAFVGIPVSFSTSDPGSGSVSYQWDFGVDATPATSTLSNPSGIVYSTPGTKTVRVTVVVGGCSATRELTATIFTTTPVIPADVTIAMADAPIVPGIHPIPVWVCPGAVLSPDGWQKYSAIYAEAGSHVDLTSDYAELVYLKAGASCTVGYESRLIIYEEGASLQFTTSHSSALIFRMPSITFDYTEAPAGGCPSLASYFVKKSDEAALVSGNRSEEASHSEFYILPDGVLNITGDENRLLVNTGGTIIADGSGYTVYLKNGARFDARNGGNHRIFYEPQAVIINAGANTGLFPADTITFQADGVTDIRLADETDQLLCFPNPTSDFLMVRCPAASGSAVLMDQLGRVCARHSFLSGETQWQCDVSHLAPGAYILQVSNGIFTRATSIIVR